MLVRASSGSGGGGGGETSLLYSDDSLISNQWNDTGVTPTGMTVVWIGDTSYAIVGFFQYNYDDGTFTTLSNARANVRIGSLGTIEVYGNYNRYRCRVYG